MLYTKGKDLSDKVIIDLQNTTPDGKALTPFYYSKDKSIRAENAEAITVSYGETSTNVPNLEKLVEALKGIDTPNTEVAVTINTDVTAASDFAFPQNKNISKIRFTNDGKKAITFTGTRLTIPYDVVFNVEIKASNSKNLIDITVAKDVTLYINKSGEINEQNNELIPYINRITGTKTSALILNYVAVNNISTFKELSGGYIYGTVTGITRLIGGTLYLFGEKSSATIESIKSFSQVFLRKNSKGELPKLTVSDVTKNALSVAVIDNAIEFTTEGNGRIVIDKLTYSQLESGRTLLYTKGKDLSDNILIQNTNGSSNEAEAFSGIKAFYDAKTRTIKAVVANAVLIHVLGNEGYYAPVENGNNGCFETLEDAVAYINANGSPDASYIITVQKSIESPKFALPSAKKAGKLNIQCVDGASINIGKLASLTTYVHTVLENVNFVTSAKTLTLNAKNNLSVGRESNINSFKGSSGYEFTASITSDNAYNVTGFGTVTVGENTELLIDTAFQTGKLYLLTNSGLALSESFKSGTFKSFSGEVGSYLKYNSANSPALRFTGKAADFVLVDNSPITIKGAVAYGSRILSTKALASPDKLFSCDSSVSLGNDITPCFTQIGNDIVILGDYFELSSTKSGEAQRFALWSEAIDAINKAKDPEASYTITVRDHVNTGSALKFPNKGTYNHLNIAGLSRSINLKFTGSLTLTGDTAFREINIYSVKANKKGGYDNVNYNINASAYDVTFFLSGTELATITAKNLVLRETASIKAERITVNDTIITWGLYVVIYVNKGITTKNWVNMIPLKLFLVNNAKLTIKNQLIREAEGMFGIQLLDKNYQAVTDFPKNYSIGTIKNGADNYLKLLNDGFELNVNEKTGAVTVKRT